MVFDSVELAYGFYVSYAHASGFSVRKNSAYTNHGLLKLKYYVCSKEGFKSGTQYSTLDDANNGKRKRRKPSKRTGCGTHIKFRLNDKNKYEVYVFEEEHNHSFVHKDDIQFLTSARTVDYEKESAIQALSQVNLGPVRAFNILKSLYGSYEQVGATKNDFKNFKTRQSEYISEYNADMVIKRFEKKKKHCPNFSFDYTIKEDDFRRNDMVFVPFTGIDNHNRNITLGVALLRYETADSYMWVLRAYAHAFGSAPKVVLTDQDAAMKRAIQDVFQIAYIDYVGPMTPKVAEFKEKLAEIVWRDSITTDEFEEKWPSILSEYGLSDHEWLADLYKIRKDWIHAHFEAAVESQWYEHRGNDRHSRYTIPGFLNPTLCIEVQIKQYHVAAEDLNCSDYYAMEKGSYFKYVTSFRPEEFGENRADVEAVLCQLRDYVKDYMSKADEAQVVAPPLSKRDRFAEMTGMREPCSVTIRNPVRTRTKGCGSHKRFKSAREIAISKAGDKQRGCGFCKGVGHNIRTCKLYLQSIKEKEATTS
ncbi:protein FAR1-RELATED SEQUENCE 5-like [Bidens hawaiensis]|uniref:protein FAR1-RELATED SEQUENCE 5-like n=1 Tax=Bidens hawaiensis TaxID=980011 RepID=UPI00404AEAF3